MKLNRVSYIVIPFLLTATTLSSCTSDSPTKPVSSPETRSTTIDEVGFPAQISLAALGKKGLSNESPGTKTCPFIKHDVEKSEIGFNQFVDLLMNEEALNRTLPLDNQQRHEAFQLVKSGQFKQDIESSIEQVYQINNDLPLVALREIRNPEMLKELPQAFAKDLARNPIKIDSAPTCVAKFANFFHKPNESIIPQNCHPKFLTNTLAAAYQSPSIIKVAKTARIFTDKNNRSMRLAVIAYARMNGINITEQDLDTMDNFFNTNKDPDITPLVLAGLQMFADQYGLNDIQAAKDKIKNSDENCSINVFQKDSKIKSISSSHFDASIAPSIEWKIAGSNLSFFHNNFDLTTLDPDPIFRKNGQSESIFEQYERIFSDSISSQNYLKSLASIINDDKRTEWNDKKNEYKSNYSTSCDQNEYAAFCQKIRLEIKNPPLGDCVWYVENYDPVPKACREPYETAIPIDKENITISVRKAGSSETLTNTTAFIKGKVILAIGDSFASGEGNPDYPTQHDDSIPEAGSGYNFFLSRGDNWNKKDKGPYWLDRTCHRSLLSNQFKVALRYAKENPTQRVVFASFSCSGAEILQGILQPQKDLPYRDGNNLNDGQLASAVKFLCGGQYESNEVGVPRDLRDLSHGETFNRVTCKDPTKLRKPDLILLSIGGNDVGFGPLSLYSLSPLFPLFPLTDATKHLDLLKSFGSFVGIYRSPKQSLNDINTKLPKLYKLLHDELDNTNLVGLSQINILQTNYPNILAGYDGENFNSNNNLGFQGIKFMVDLELKIPYIKKWFDKWSDISISPEEAKDINTIVIEKLKKQVKNNELYGWKIVELSPTEIQKHGLFSLDKDSSGQELSPQETFKFPYREKEGVTPKWQKYFKPSDWQPYLPKRQRWFNTGDDAIMKVSTRLCPESWQIPNIIYAYVLNKNSECLEMLRGGLHPGLAFHANSADEMYKEAKNILQNGMMAKY